MNCWITYDGRLFEASDAATLVELYRSDTIIQTKDMNDFMKQMCVWTRLYCDAQLDPTTPDTFVQSLLDNRLLTKWEMN